MFPASYFAKSFFPGSYFPPIAALAEAVETVGGRLRRRRVVRRQERNDDAEVVSIAKAFFDRIIR
jgi:hypothetical protein